MMLKVGDFVRFVGCAIRQASGDCSPCKDGGYFVDDKGKVLAPHCQEHMRKVFEVMFDESAESPWVYVAEQEKPVFSLYLKKISPMEFLGEQV